MSAVEWKKLGDVCEFRTGWGFPENEQGKKNEKYPFYKVADMNNSTMFMDIANNYISEDIANKLRCKPAPKGTIIFPKIGATMATNKKRILTKDSCYDNNIMGLIAKSINDKYLYYFISRFELLDFAKGTGAVPSLDTNKLKSFEIPIPSLAKQQEIVSHLDTFTSLISNLESELDMRRKQYEHYRNQLLDFEGVEGVEWKTLGEVGEFVRGNGIQKKDFVEDGYGCVHYGQVYTQFDLLAYETITGIEKSLYDKCRKAKCGDIVLATTSENLEDVAKPVIWLGEEEIAVSGDAFIYKHNQNPIFMGSQFLTERFSKFKGMNAKGAKVIRITGDSMAEYKIALPSLEKQNEIAEGIKSFENLIQSLEQEIKLRKQQYEYYREKLLTFE